MKLSGTNYYYGNNIRGDKRGGVFGGGRCGGVPHSQIFGSK